MHCLESVFAGKAKLSKIKGCKNRARFIRKTLFKPKQTNQKMKDSSIGGISQSPSPPSTEEPFSRPFTVLEGEGGGEVIFAVLQKSRSRRESSEVRFSETTNLLLSEKLRSKMKKIKNFWVKNSRISPHVFKILVPDFESSRFFYQVNDLGHKGTNQKSLEERKHLKTCFRDFSENSGEEHLSNPLSLGNLEFGDNDVLFD